MNKEEEKKEKTSPVMYRLTPGPPCDVSPNRLHRGRSGRSFSRSNSRNRSTSRAPPCHRTTPSDQRGGSSGRQPMNVALSNGQRPTQTKAKAKGDMQGRPAAPGSKPKNFTRGKTSESQRLRALCALPAL